ncbi:MAG: HlyD family efflux transporter periplasmic adaptor subunit, partial [Acidimicrobiales bacterium]
MDVVAGQTVQPGQPLVSLADPVLQAQLSAAEAAVATAQAKLAAAQAPPDAQAVLVAQDGVAKAQAALTAADQTYQQAQTAAQAAAPAASTQSGAQVIAAQENVTVAQAALALAQAQAAQAEAPPTSATLQPLIAAVAQSQAAAAVIQAQLAQDALTAPFAGTVMSLAATPGEEVSAGTSLLTLDGSALSVQAPVSQANLPLLREGETATVSVLGGQGALPATVTAVSPSANPSSLTFDVTLTPTSTPPWLHAGEAASASVVTASTSGAVLVPASAVVAINGTPQVFVVTPGGPGA